MSLVSEPVVIKHEPAVMLSHRRLLIEMGVVIAIEGIIGFLFGGPRFAGGILAGGALAFVNYFWLKRSLGLIFASTAEGSRPRFVALRYIFRYILIGLALFFIYMTDQISVAASILGLASFSIAVVIDGLWSVTSGFFKGKV